MEEEMLEDREETTKESFAERESEGVGKCSRTARVLKAHCMLAVINLTQDHSVSLCDILQPRSAAQIKAQSRQKHI